MTRHSATNGMPLKSLLALAVATVVAPPLHAQRIMLEEVVVTAEHREATIQDTQISISAISSMDIQELGLSNGAEIGQIVPNVTITNFIGGRTGFGVNIRGIGNNETLLTYDPAVGMYINDVLISKNSGGLLDVIDMERIEVLRGPQGTLYGRNTMGGAVNIVSKKPVGQLEGGVQATIGNYGQRDVRGTLNVPLLGTDSPIGEMNLRMSAGKLERDGIQDNDYVNAPQRELGTRDRDIFMGQVLWQPMDALQVLYSYDRTRIDEIPEVPWVTVANPARPAGTRVAPYLQREGDRPDSIEVNDVGVAETEVDGHSLHFDFEVNDSLSLKSISAYREMKNYGQADSDGTPLPLIMTLDDQEYEFKSQEFRLVGVGFDNRLDYSVGLFYMEESGDVWSGTLTSGANLSATVADFDNKNWALYGQATWSLTDRMRLTGGLRYTDEDREMSKAAVSATGAVTPFPAAKRSYDNMSPMISLSYDWDHDLMTYARISTGFQSGGFNVRDTTPQDFLRGFDEETLIAYELGIKSTLFDRVRLNASAFYSDYDDKRVNNLNPVTLGNTVLNAGVVEIYGGELEMLAQLDENWQLGVNYGYTKPKYKEYDVTDPSNLTQTIDMSGSSNFPYTPRHDLNVNLTYERPVDYGVVRARLDWSYKDEMTFLVAQPERNSASGYSLWNARLTLDEIKGPGDTTMRVSLWGKNLTDESYWNFGVNLFSTFGFDFNTYGEPRTFGVDFAVDF